MREDDSRSLLCLQRNFAKMLKPRVQAVVTASCSKYFLSRWFITKRRRLQCHLRIALCTTCFLVQQVVLNRFFESRQNIGLVLVGILSQKTMVSGLKVQFSLVASVESSVSSGSEVLSWRDSPLPQRFAHTLRLWIDLYILLPRFPLVCSLFSSNQRILILSPLLIPLLTACRQPLRSAASASQLPVSMPISFRSRLQMSLKRNAGRPTTCY